jgi:hypothetical protein
MYTEWLGYWETWELTTQARASFASRSERSKNRVLFAGIVSIEERAVSDDAEENRGYGTNVRLVVRQRLWWWHFGG